MSCNATVPERSPVSVWTSGGNGPDAPGQRWAAVCTGVQQGSGKPALPTHLQKFKTAYLLQLKELRRHIVSPETLCKTI